MRELDHYHADKEPSRWRVHRFHDAVAVNVGDGSTTYLTPEAAERLALQLIVFSFDVKTWKFTRSVIGTQEGPTNVKKEVQDAR